MSIKWYSIKSRAPAGLVAAEGAPAKTAAEVFIYGDIGESWWGDSITAADFVKDFAALDASDITVRINSYGGSVSDGIAIYNAIKRHPAKVTVAIDGVAFSIASLIAMAGDTVEIAENAMLMIHAPWGAAVGNSVDMRDMADVLDKYALAMSSSYAAKSGKSTDDVMALLLDGADHWYTADEALAEGFVDSVTVALAIAASVDRADFAARFQSLPAAFRQQFPAAAAAQPKEQPMPNPNPNAGGTAPTAEITAEQRQQIEAAAVTADANRRNAILAYKESSFAVGNAALAKLIDDCAGDTKCTVQAAKDKILAKLGDGAKPIAGVFTVEDETDKQIRAAEDALLVRAGVHRMRGNGAPDLTISMQGNPFRGATLLDLAKASLRRNGKNPEGMTKREVVAQAFQTTSDFPTLLENTMHKVLLRAYTTAADTWSRFCKTGDVSDFRAHNRYRTGSIGNLDSLTEQGEFKTKTIPDAEKGSITATTKGNIIGITREVIINDDLQGLTDLFAMAGRAYKRTIEAAVYALLAENNGLGPPMLDSYTLFHASHGNIGAGAALAMASIEADRVLMASQTDVGGNDYLDLRPDVLLVPIGLGGTAREVNSAEYNDEASKNQRRPNVVRGLFNDIVDTPRLTGTRRYLFANKDEAPVIEVAFLDGMQEPYVETRDGWSTDGAELKVRGDFGVAATDYRGAVTDAGA